MWEDILNLVISYGLMPALFVALLIWVLKDSRARESNYQKMVDKLHDTLAVVNDIQKLTKEIHRTLIKKKENQQS